MIGPVPGGGLWRSRIFIVSSAAHGGGTDKNMLEHESECLHRYNLCADTTLKMCIECWKVSKGYEHGLKWVEACD